MALFARRRLVRAIVRDVWFSVRRFVEPGREHIYWVMYCMFIKRVCFDGRTSAREFLWIVCAWKNFTSGSLRVTEAAWL